MALATPLNHRLSTLSDVTVTSIGANEILQWNGSIWLNQTLAEAGIAAASHTHVEADIADLQAYLLSLADDITPQLGGDLDVAGQSIVSASNGNIVIAPNGSGSFDVVHSQDTATHLVARFYSTGRTAAADNDSAYWSYFLQNELEADVEFGRLTLVADDALNGSEDLRWRWSAVTGGSLVTSFEATGAGLHLGDGKNLHLGAADDATLDWDGNNAVFTLTAGFLNVVGGNMEVTKTGAPAGIYIDRTDGQIGAITAGGSAVAIRFEDSTSFQFQTQPRVDLESQNGLNVTTVLTIGSDGSVTGMNSVAVPSDVGGPTIDAVGELGVDTTSDTLNFHDGTAERVLNPERQITISVESPTSSEDITIGVLLRASTITKIRAVLVGSSTPSVTWTIRHSTDRSAAGNEVVTGGTTTTGVTTGDTVTSFDDASVPADSWVWLETTAQSGTVALLAITIFYKEDA